MNLTTETLDRAYLEYSNITSAITRKEIELAMEVERLKIAYQNASDQRQHYVEKCLKLSEGFLESHELLNNHNNFAKDILELEGANWTNIDAFFDKHKDLIEELKRNLEVKSE